MLVGDAAALVGVIAALGVVAAVGDPLTAVGDIATLGVVIAVADAAAGADVPAGVGLVNAVLGTSTRVVYWVATGPAPTLTVETTLPVDVSITVSVF